jgi:hypothetical protein
MLPQTLKERAGAEPVGDRRPRRIVIGLATVVDNLRMGG